jgi:hypothetical protein
VKQRQLKTARDTVCFVRQLSGSYRREKLGGRLLEQRKPEREQSAVHAADPAVNGHGVPVIGSRAKHDRGPEAVNSRQMLGPCLSGDRFVENWTKDRIGADLCIEGHD